MDAPSTVDCVEKTRLRPQDGAASFSRQTGSQRRRLDEEDDGRLTGQWGLAKRSKEDKALDAYGVASMCANSSYVHYNSGLGCDIAERCYISPMLLSTKLREKGGALNFKCLEELERT